MSEIGSTDRASGPISALEVTFYGCNYNARTTLSNETTFRRYFDVINVLLLEDVFAQYILHLSVIV